MFSGWGLSWAGWLDNRRGEWWLGGQLQPVWGEKVGAMLGVTVGMTHLIRSAMRLQRSFEREDQKR